MCVYSVVCPLRGDCRDSLRQGSVAPRHTAAHENASLSLCLLLSYHRTWVDLRRMRCSPPASHPKPQHARPTARQSASPVGERARQAVSTYVRTYVSRTDWLVIHSFLVIHLHGACESVSQSVSQSAFEKLWCSFLVSSNRATCEKLHFDKSFANGLDRHPRLPTAPPQLCPEAAV